MTERSRTCGNAPYVTVASVNGVSTISYRELDILSRRLAHWLRYELQVRSGDIIGFIPENDLLSVVTIFGLLRCGCTALFLNRSDPVARLRSQVEALSVRATLRSSRVPADSLPESIATPDVWTLDEELEAECEPTIDPMGDALAFGTSGSTSTSKIVVQSHYNAAVNSLAARRHHHLAHGDRFLGCLPLHHVNGLHFTLFATLSAGAHAILADSFDPVGFLQLIDRFRPRMSSVVPSLLELLLDMRQNITLPSEFGYFISAAAPLTTQTARGVARKMAVRVLQGYGLTETTNFSTTVPLDLSQAAYERLIQDADIPSVGTALYGNEIRVLTRSGSNASPGQIGEICMRGHNVMMRYAGNPSATAEAFRDGWFHSQDLGFETIDRDSGRKFFVLTGRMKNIAKVGGEAVSLEEMERILCQIPQVRDAACISFPHRILGEEIVAAIVLSQGVTPADVRAHLRKAFTPAALPRRIVTLKGIPRTNTGKIRRLELSNLLNSTNGEEPL